MPWRKGFRAGQGKHLSGGGERGACSGEQHCSGSRSGSDVCSEHNNTVTTRTTTNVTDMYSLMSRVVLPRSVPVSGQDPALS